MDDQDKYPTSHPRRSRRSRACGREAQSRVGGEVLRERGNADKIALVFLPNYSLELDLRN